MKTTTTRTADMLRTGDMVMERDGYLLTVAKVESYGQGVRIHFERTGMVAVKPTTLRGSTRVRVMVAS